MAENSFGKRSLLPYKIYYLYKTTLILIRGAGQDRTGRPLSGRGVSDTKDPKSWQR